jgi:hypothetical protein
MTERVVEVFGKNELRGAEFVKMFPTGGVWKGFFPQRLFLQE